MTDNPKKKEKGKEKGIGKGRGGERWGEGQKGRELEKTLVTMLCLSYFNKLHKINILN